MLTTLIEKISGLINYGIVYAAAAPTVGVNFGSLGSNSGGAMFDSLDNFIQWIVNLVFGIGVSLALIFLIVCGVKYTMSAGDQGKAEEARNCITNAVIGAVVVIAFRLLINFALTILGVTGVAGVTGVIAP